MIEKVGEQIIEAVKAIIGGIRLKTIGNYAQEIILLYTGNYYKKKGKLVYTENYYIQETTLLYTGNYVIIKKKKKP